MSRVRMRVLSRLCRVLGKQSQAEGSKDLEDFDAYLERVNRSVHSIQFGVRSLVYHREIVSASTESRFWLHTSTQLLRSYILYWSNVLGNDANDTHWKRIALDTDAFRSKLLGRVGMRKRDLKKYWREIQDLRNKVMAHDDANWPAQVPDLEPSLRLLKALHPLLKEEAIERGEQENRLVKFEILSIDQFHENLEEEARLLITAAIDATRPIDEFQ